MTDFFSKAIAWIKANILLAIGIGILIIVIFFPKVLRHIIGPKRRVVHRVVRETRHRRNVRKAITGSYRRRPSTRTRRMKGAKKPWQVKGSRAARLHMAKIRRLR